jgi:hypothetical protein
MSKRVETLEEVRATLSIMQSAVWSLQVIIANELEQERANADEVPLSEYYAAAAEGALDVADEPEWTEEDERDAAETIRYLCAGGAR